ncbi:MAG: ATP-binding protein, partial [Candidatus Cloacimonetes bacterium]|nr:ATP-binding protein [Candidatus Cloacimonadota bacterium]
SIHQAIWVVDENTRIQTGNANFEKLISEADYQGHFLSDIMPNHQIIKVFHDTVAEKSHLNQEIEYKKKVYIISSTYLKTNGNVIFTLLDISDMKSIESFKKDIVSNVSHELKTPLTSIKGFVETLLTDATPEQIRYLQIVQRNTDRLITIVSDILSLSMLEQKKGIIRHEVNVSSFFQKLEKLFDDAGKKQNTKLIIKIIGDNFTFDADEFLLEQAFVNLIDNAIKYSEKGSVTVAGERILDKVVFEVSDEGIGIPKEHLNRIFERFYVVDKNRSKRLGGTGLGLSIVKHIVHLHYGEIEVQSEVNEGTSFILRLPAS